MQKDFLVYSGRIVGVQAADKAMRKVFDEQFLGSLDALVKANEKLELKIGFFKTENSQDDGFASIFYGTKKELRECYNDRSFWEKAKPQITGNFVLFLGGAKKNPFFVLNRVKIFLRVQTDGERVA
jgi:hypothetical protein